MTEAVDQAHGPRQATFHPLMTCNARCPFCSTRVYTDDGIVAADDYARGTTRRLDEHTFDFQGACAEYRRMRDRGVDSVAIQGGEPTLFPRLDELIAFGKSIGFTEQVVVTNGRKLADAAFARRLHECGLATISLSIFGSEARVHDESLGASGCFDELVQGVRNLVLLGSPARGPSLTAQLLLHAKNYWNLPQMFSFWYGIGIRQFTIRLLRETANTERAADNEWFFDLSLLRPHLSATLDAANDREDARVGLAEVPHCLVAPSHLPWVLRELTGSHRLHRDRLVTAKQTLRVLNYSVSRQPRSADPRLFACDACDARSACLRVEDQYLARLSESLAPWDFERVAHALGHENEPAAIARSTALLRRPELLLESGAQPATALALLRRIARRHAAHAPARLARALISTRGREELRRRHDRTATDRFVRLSDLVASPKHGSLGGDVRSVLSDLRTRAIDSEASAKLAFLAAADPIAAGPLCAIVGGALRRRDALSIAYVAVLFDDGCIDEDSVRVALAHARGD